MEFPLLKLPFLAIQEVLSMFQFHEIIDFSFCSTRSKRLIQSLKRHPYLGIHLASHRSNQQIILETGERTGDIWDFSFKPLPQVSPEYLRKIGSIEFQFSKTNENTILSQKIPVTLVKVVYDYLQELFNNLPISKFFFTANRDHGSLLPDYFGITKCRELYLHDDTKPIPEAQLRYIFEKVQVQIYLSLHLKKNRNFRLNTIVKLSTDEIKADVGWMSRDTFLSLDCTRLHLKSVNLTTNNYEDFVRKWLRSTSTRFIWMKCSFEMRFDPFDFSRFQTTPWDPKVRGRWFGMRHVNPLMGGLKVDCSDGMDIRRTTDGLLATIKWTLNSFHFVVWHERFHDFGEISENQLII